MRSSKTTPACGARAARIAPSLALAAALASAPGVAAADEPGPDSLPITVVAIQPHDADDQAEALTKALRSAIREMPGWSVGEGDYSLEVLTLSLKCPEPPDAACQSRIADQIKADRYVWGVVRKTGANITGEVHLWERGKGTTKVPLDYSANLTEATDEALKQVARNAIVQLTGGPPKGTVHIKAGNIAGQVFVDGQPIGALTNGEGTFPIPAGSHRVVVKAIGYADGEASVVVKPNATADVTLSPVASEPDTPTNWRLIGGFAGLGAGVGFGVVGLVSSLKILELRGDEQFEQYKIGRPKDGVCDQARAGSSAEDKHAAEVCDEAASAELMQAIFYSLAAVSGGVGIYLLATSGDSGDEPSTGVTVRPQFGRKSGSIDLTYRW